MTLSIDEIIENFSFIDDWEERYRYVIELGKDLPALEENEMVDAHKVEGCVSQVWLIPQLDYGTDGPVLTFIGDSDAHIVKGLIAITLAIFSGQPAKDIIEIDAEAVFAKLGLREHLTPQRSNGLTAMIERVKVEAQAALDAARDV